MRGGKRLRNQLKELQKKAERGFMVMEMACGAMVSDFEVKEMEVKNANIWGRKLESRQEH